MMDDLQNKFRNLLETLFHFDNEHLDIGIFRVLNNHRKELQDFIDNRIISELESQLKTKNLQNQLPQVYNHFIRFFSRYYYHGDFIAQRRYGRNARYVIPYHGEEFNFFWVNKNQYYIKSGEYFSKYSFTLASLTIQLKLVHATTEKGNIKSKHKKFFLLHHPAYHKQDHQLTIYFEYRSLTTKEITALGKSVKQPSINESILAELKSLWANDPDLSNLLNDLNDADLLNNHLCKFTNLHNRNRDFFVHKNLNQFLDTELDFYLKNEVLNLDSFDQCQVAGFESKLEVAGIIKNISGKIITFLSQIEDFRKKMWEKKSLVLKTHFVITLGYIRKYAGEEYFNSILQEVAGNRSQLSEWQQLVKFDWLTINKNHRREQLLKKKWNNLPVDTALFNDSFKWQLLNALCAQNNLDNLLEGILIHSENWQALQLLQEKFSGKIKSIYIDPPFNKEKEADYFYKVGFQDSTWITLLENRIRAAKSLIAPDGCMFVRCDYNGSMYVRFVMDYIFGRDNFRNEIVVNRTLAKQKVDSQFVVQTESLFLYSQSQQFTPYQIERPIAPKWYPLLHFPRKDERPRKALGKLFYPPKNRRWALSQKRIDQLAEKGKLRINEEACYLNYRGEEIRGMPELLYDSQVVGNEWLDIPGYAQRHHFPTENAEALLKRVIESSSRAGDWVMDFFLGSGTTIAMAQKMKRKWIGIEMGDHLYSVILPRMKKVLFGDKSAISKEIGWSGGGFFKYQTLEQFEDTLENIEYQEPASLLLQTEDYFQKHLLPHQAKNSIPFLDISKLSDPFDYPIKTFGQREGSYSSTDLAESFNYLLGLSIKKVFKTASQQIPYLFVFGDKEGQNIAIVWRSLENIDFQIDKNFIEDTVLPFTPDRIYVNGDCAVKGFINIEQEMQRLI